MAPTVLGCPGVCRKAETYNDETVRAQSRKSHVVASANSKKQAMGLGEAENTWKGWMLRSSTSKPGKDQTRLKNSLDQEKQRL